MKALILSLTLVLTGCFASAPVKQKFPEAPQVLKERCESLKKVEELNIRLRQLQDALHDVIGSISNLEAVKMPIMRPISHENKLQNQIAQSNVPQALLQQNR